jgi:DNA repair photolyase
LKVNPGQPNNFIPLTITGRGAAANPTNRFEKLDIDIEPESFDPDQPAPKTIFLKDSTRNIIAKNDSPDVGFEISLNPYRGCEHGCIYCYARPTHEYLGFSAGLDFETKIMVKLDAPELLRKELSNPRWKPQPLAMSGVTDCYQPIERKLQITRQCLQVLEECSHPVIMITKNHLVTRDVDLLAKLASRNLTAIMITITTLDPHLTRLMEPRTAVPQRRLDAIRTLAENKIPVGVMVAPIIPGLTDHVMSEVLKAAADAGAKFAGYTTLRLPLGVAPLFEDWLTRHFPDRKDKILNRIRSMHHGKLSESQFGDRMSGHGIWAEQLRTLFDLAKRKAGVDQPFPMLDTESFRPPRNRK